MERPYGFALVVNIKQFVGTTDDGKTLNEREGSDVDVKNLKDLWEQLGFKVEVHKNLKAHEICTIVSNMARKIDETSNCFVCCIMTHGDMDILYGSDCRSLDISYVIHSFKQKSCKALADKPKLFFIQACRGSQYLLSSPPQDSKNEETGKTKTTKSCHFSSNKTGASDKPISGMSPSNSSLPDTGSTDATLSLTTLTKEATSQKGDHTDAPPSISSTNASDTREIESWSNIQTEDDVEYDSNDSAFRDSAGPNEPHFLLGYSTAPGKSITITAFVPYIMNCCSIPIRPNE